MMVWNLDQTMEFEDMAEKASKRPLTQKQEMFVAYYLTHRNATQAAIQAGYSEKSAGKIGSQLLEKTGIKAEINRRTQGMVSDLKWDAQRTLLEITRMANIDPEVYKDIHSPQDFHKLPEDARRAIVGWGWDKNGNFTIKFAKERSLEMLGKHLKLFTDVVEIKDETGLAARMDKARRRAKGKGE